MDQNKNTTTTTAAAAADSPDTDGETPLHSQLIKPISSFPTGKNHHHRPYIQPSLTTTVAYKECLKNHAATIGSHAVDGCGEFIQSSTSSLKCAACGCHRNFHRRHETTTNSPHFLDYIHARAPHVLLSLSNNNHHHIVPITPGTPAVENSIGSRKRFRTKFSQQQKDQMCKFAESMGWKMQRCNDKKVTDFCNEIGIRRGIFKVWMHNNKNTFGKKLDINDTILFPTTTASAVAVVSGVDTAVVISSECHEKDVSKVDGICDNSNGSSSIC